MLFVAILVVFEVFFYPLAVCFSSSARFPQTGIEMGSQSFQEKIHSSAWFTRACRLSGPKVALNHPRQDKGIVIEVVSHPGGDGAAIVGPKAAQAARSLRVFKQ